MPDTGIKKLEDGRYKVDIRPHGVFGKRYRKIWPTLLQAKRDKAKQIAKADGVVSLYTKHGDRRQLSELAELWYQLHGHTLKDGKNRLSNMLNLIRIMGDPTIAEFDDTFYITSRIKRLSSGVTKNTANHDLTHLKSMFNVIAKHQRGFVNPLLSVQKIKTNQAPITFLETHQINMLLAELENDCYGDCKPICYLALSTGARWGEAEKLQGEQLKANHVEFFNTKNTKSRVIPIDHELHSILTDGRRRKGRLFKNSYNYFDKLMTAIGVELPRGQRTHVLRHTFSVHFMLGRGNILDLQKILGHSTLQMTLRYAQYHPDYLHDAVRLNPLAQIRSHEKK